jgi:phenylpropionate dioxygenase-like ring-hydroxylating dioxygenase large terminal subunit
MSLMDTEVRVSAPLPRSDLERALAPMGESRTLPSAAYVSDEVFAWEQARFLDASWVCVGRRDAVAEAGSQRAVRAGTETVMLTRGEDQRLRAFFNVCRHRGHELLELGESRTNKVIQCPYHAWIYNLDGTLRGAPGFNKDEGFDRSEHPLSEVRVDEWRGWVFVNVSADAPGLGEHVGNLDEHLAPYEPERLVTAVRHNYEVAANWKVVTENYHECYHCSSIHPELCRVTPPDSGENIEPTGVWVGGSMDLMDHAETMSLSGESHGEPLRGLNARQQRQVLYLALFPNLLISPHPDYVLTHRLEPLEPGRTKIECEWLFPAEVAARDGFDPSYAVEFWDITNRQDWGACESVQRGIRSRGFRPGPLSSREDEVHDFMALVARGYIEGLVRPPVV